MKVIHEEIIADQMVSRDFLEVGESCVELLEPTSPESPIAKYMEKKGQGIHHIAYAVADVEAALANAKDQATLDRRKTASRRAWQTDRLFAPKRHAWRIDRVLSAHRGSRRKQAVERKMIELHERRRKIELGGGDKRIAAQHAKGKLTARERLEILM